MRQNNILRHALQKNIQLLERLKSLPPEELRMELLKGTHQKEFVLDPTKINQLGKDDSGDLHIEQSDSKADIVIQDDNETEQKDEPSLREISFKAAREEAKYENIDKSSDAHSYQKTNDYISYGYDYTGMPKDPQNVDVSLPVQDYVYQLLCNPQCTDEIFKEKMIEYQYFKDKPIEKEISKVRREIKKCKCCKLLWLIPFRPNKKPNEEDNLQTNR